MSRFSVNINDIESFRSLLDDANKETTEAKSQVEKYYSDLTPCRSNENLYGLLMENYRLLNKEILHFLSMGIKAVEYTSTALEAAVTEYAATDASGAQKLDDSYKSQIHSPTTTAPYGPGDLHPRDDAGGEAGEIKYRPSEVRISNPEYMAGDCWYLDPERHFTATYTYVCDIDLGTTLKDKSFMDQLSGVGIDIDAIVAPFRGNWALAQARIEVLDWLTKEMSSVGDNIISGGLGLNVTWDGNSARDAINLIRILGEAFKDPNNDLKTSHDEYFQIVEGMDAAAKEAASTLARILILADVYRGFYPDFSNNTTNTVPGSVVAWAQDTVGAVAGSVVSLSTVAGAIAAIHEMYWPLRILVENYVSEMTCYLLSNYVSPAVGPLKSSRKRLAEFKKIDRLV